MKCENPKPSEVVYVFLATIATILLDTVRLVAKCLWLLGSHAVKLVTSSPKSEKD